MTNQITRTHLPLSSQPHKGISVKSISLDKGRQNKKKISSKEHMKSLNGSKFEIKDESLLAFFQSSLTERIIMTSLTTFGLCRNF